MYSPNKGEQVIIGYGDDPMSNFFCVKEATTVTIGNGNDKDDGADAQLLLDSVCN